MVRQLYKDSQFVWVRSAMGRSLVHQGLWLISSLISPIVLLQFEPAAMAMLALGTETTSLQQAAQAYVSPNDVRVYLAPESDSPSKHVSFIPPAGFTPMSDIEIRHKFPSQRPPQYVYANRDRTVTIAITFSQAALNPDQLEQLKMAMEEALQKVIKQWGTRNITSINGVSWVRLESTTETVEKNSLIHNDMYLTSYNGKMLGFNFNSVAHVDKQFRQSLLQSAQTIQIEPTANP